MSAGIAIDASSLMAAGMAVAGVAIGASISPTLASAANR